MKVAVFLSSTEQVSPMFLAEAERIGEVLAEAGHAVVYGGTHTGCMGALAQGVLRRKGRLIGVLPKMDFAEGLVQPGLSEQVVVPNMSARKQAMVERADAFVIFPGGIGTLDEAFEVLALKSLGTLKRPVVFYNFLSVWTPLLDALELLVQQRLIRHGLDEVLVVLDKPEQLKENLRA